MLKTNVRSRQSTGRGIELAMICMVVKTALYTVENRYRRHLLACYLAEKCLETRLGRYVLWLVWQQYEGT
jgi:hypothetical protein